MPRKSGTRGRYWWSRLSDDELLDVRLCDLDISVEDSPLQERVDQLYAELDERGLRFRPPCWLSNEWFSPNNVPGIAMPFYLAHPRLMKLEDHMMLEVEGGTRTWCMQLLRHEAGHAYETAYRLGRRTKWRRMFGSASKPYPEFYSPRPVSRHYVLHLDWWYAQSHPCEDFAETFAVWLRPSVSWRRRYAGWPAMRKLEYVDELMGELAGKAPSVRSRAKVDPISRLRYTLREHYEERQSHYGRDYPEFFDRDLRKLFPDPKPSARTRSAAAFLRRAAPDLCTRVARWTGEHSYTVSLVIKDMRVRCKQLRLRTDRPEEQLRMDTAVLLTMATMEFVYSTRHKVAL